MATQHLLNSMSVKKTLYDLPDRKVRGLESTVSWLGSCRHYRLCGVGACLKMCLYTQCGSVHIPTIKYVCECQFKSS